MIHTYEVQELSEVEFSGFDKEWQDCLDHSSADPIFSSWPWCYSWWITWAKRYSLALQLIVITYDDQVVAIAPLFTQKVRRTLGPLGDQLQFIGNLWRRRTVRSEYTGFIIRKGHETNACGALFSYLKSKKLADFIICDHKPEFLELLDSQGYRVTNRGVDRGICVDVRGDFQEWIGSLGKNTRLKLYNRRTYLGGRLVHSSVPFTDPVARKVFFNLLCDLHLNRRQDKPTGEELAFHQNLAIFCDNHLEPVYRVMKVDGEPVSAIYDIIAHRRRYNLHSVFLQDFDKKVSLGTLHLGFALEEAFANPDIEIYDFLAGAGKNSFYKDRLQGDRGSEYQLMTSQISWNLWHRIYLDMHMVARKISNWFTRHLK